MSMESEPAISFSNTGTVEDLISYLRSTFLSADFQNVAKTLTQREEDMKLSLSQASTEAEKWRNECETMKEKIIALTQEENDLAEKDKLGVGEERYSKLLNEVKDLSEKNKGLNSSKVRAEADAEKWKKMFYELDARISRLEDEVSEFLVKNPKKAKELEEIGICTDVHKGGNGGNTSTGLANGVENFCKITNSSLAGGNQSQSLEVIEIDSDDEDEPARDVSTCKNVRPSDLKSDEEKMFLNIEGSDQIGMENAEDSVLASKKRKRANIITSVNENSDDDNTPIGKRKLKFETSPVESRLDDTSSVGGNNTHDVSPKSPDLGGKNTDTEFNPRSKIPGFIRRGTEKSEAKLSSPVHLSDSSDISDSDDGNDGDDFFNGVIASIQRQKEKL